MREKEKHETNKPYSLTHGPDIIGSFRPDSDNNKFTRPVDITSYRRTNNTFLQCIYLFVCRLCPKTECTTPNAMKNHKKKKKKMLFEGHFLNGNTCKVSIRYYIYCRRPHQHHQPATTNNKQTTTYNSNNRHKQILL